MIIRKFSVILFHRDAARHTGKKAAIEVYQAMDPFIIYYGRIGP